MRYTAKLATPPLKEPVSLEDARWHARVVDDPTEEDWLILAALRAARELAEAKLNRKLISQEWDISLESFPPSTEVFPIPLSPVQSITSILYYNDAGERPVLDPGSYECDMNQQLAYLRPMGGGLWPSIPRRFDAVVIRVKVGFGDDPEDVPEGVRLWIKAAFTATYESRNLTSERSVLAVNPFLDGLLNPHAVVFI